VLTYVWWFDPAQGRYVTAELSGLPVVAKNHWYVLYDLQSGEKRP